MACFIVPATEAVVVAVVKKVEEKREKKSVDETVQENEAVRIPFSRKLKWLTWMLAGGAFLLAFEHVWHGEVVAWFPFLSAMSDPEETSQMLHEMATVGVSMAGLITVTWICMCVAANHIVKRGAKTQKTEEQS